MSKIVMLERDNIGEDVDLNYFETLGELTIYGATPYEQVVDRIGDADVLVINKIPMNEATLKDAQNVKLICVTATGTDNVDMDYCASRGIAVKNVRSYSTESVVQHTFAMFFYLSEKLRFYDDYVKNGEYMKCPRFTYFGETFHELYGKTWGIVGLGEIGARVADIAKAFGCKVIYYSTSGQNSNEAYERVDFDTLLGESDIISVHAPLNEKTKYLFTYDVFAKMKPSAYFINVGRGPIVKEADLCKALNENLIAGAGLDVLEKEPMVPENPLFAIKDSRKLLITPHIAWATTEARNRLMENVYKNIKENA
ncbi:MAG: D-2-hydroxyacid dehydrogenase [Lachnospiraceae bacterium]|nr:D-2-hydroxyacid dehydrogenase [Lachnospiraceae bacterium]